MKWLDWLSDHLPMSVQHFFKRVSQLANFGFIYFILVLVFWLCHRPMMAQKLLAFILSSYVVCDLILKRLIARPRPSHINDQKDLLIKNPKDASFPSGHTYKAFGLAMVLALNGYWLLFIIFLIFAIMVAFSRMVLYVHYFSDIVGGFILGIIHALILCGIMA